ncbi:MULTISPECIES: hypothetical protein [unclassified Epibacterium]|jgi:hypothetical protein|uniref:hypothetical protein n=1 Tax=unclassified Epibacterium TaxID=2639179 RepID=UPI001EF42D90|nr:MULTISPECIES: hypothetical protein [unclassified Epibacterium]MCG7623093.1 hypothetical protein [Epibacterium sp. Ofav1-8]MCG7627426.1 hypothetical protein [Epibacterium sp. MM17-32]
MRKSILAAFLAGTAVLAACGDTTGEQALYGAGAGAAGAALLNGSLVTGAAVGAAGNLIYCQENPGRC